MNFKNSTTQNFNIYHTNANGLESHFENIHQFITSSNTNFDVINITETSQKVDEYFKQNISIDGFNSYFTPSNTAKGGTGIYVKSSYNSFERSDLNVIHDDYESSWVEIMNSRSKNIVCACIYRHPRANMDEFLTYMENCLNKISREKKEVYLSGDFNIDLLKIENNAKYMTFYNTMTSHVFLPQIIHPTRMVGSSATVIDNIFSNCLEHNMLSGNILISISEHFSQFLTVDRKSIDLKSTNIYQRDYSKFSTEAFREDISIQKWENNYADVNDQFNDFYMRLDACVDRHAPLKKLKFDEMKTRSKPWITPPIIKLIRERDKLFNRKKSQPNNDNITALYNLFRNRVNRELKKSKKAYYNNYFNEHKNNIKMTWNGIKSIINTKNTTSYNISHLSDNGKVINKPDEIANAVNNFFVNVGPNTERTVPRTPPEKIPPEFYLKQRKQFNFIVAHVSEEEIFEIINALENKATGPNSIPLKLLKLIPDLIILPLCKIINTSFGTGKFPDALKIVKVIPIHKGGPTDDMNNFRPISLLSIFDKIIEKLMHKRLYIFRTSWNPF